MSDYKKLNLADLANVPEVLKTGKRFICWRHEIREGEPTKVPVNALTGTNAKSNDPDTWQTLEKVLATFNHPPFDLPLMGVGRMFPPKGGLGGAFDDGIIGLDLDDCLDSDGNIATPFAQEWLPKVNSYTETSSGSKGVKVFVRARPDLGGRCGRIFSVEGCNVEIHQTGKPFALTGKRLSQFSPNVEERQAVVEQLLKALESLKPSKPVNKSAAKPDPCGWVDDEEVLRRANSFKNGEKFSQLMAGNWESAGAYPSASEADFALVNLLWFASGGNAEQVRELFLSSDLWQRDGNKHPESYVERLLGLVEGNKFFVPSLELKPTLPTADDPDALQDALQDRRPKVRLPGANRLLSDFATDLAGIVGDKLFLRNGEIVTLDKGKLVPMTPPEFRTWGEKLFCGYKVKSSGENLIQFNVTMTQEDASGVLASPQFRENLRPVLQVNDCRLPVLRSDDKLELLPEGYDAQSQTLTLPVAEYQTDMTIEDARSIMDDLFSEFTFADEGRSKAVAIAGMVGLFCKHILPRLTLRPCLVAVANAEGAGKSILVAVMTTPALGAMPTGCKTDCEEEMVKQLVTVIREARALVFLDNIKGFFSSGKLEAFLTAPLFEARKLGVNQNISGENLATVIITGNGLTVSPDIRRRSLFIELRLEVERAEDKEFRRPLDIPTLLAMRSQVLAALWTLVRHWDAQGRPKPSRSHSAFVSWANVVGGIVELAGFGCPLETAEVAIAADQDGDDMRKLVEGMKPDAPYSFGKLVTLARSLSCFEGLIGDDDELDRKQKSALGRLLGRYDKRLVGNGRFVIHGKGHSRTYLHGRMVRHGLAPVLGKMISPVIAETPCLTMRPCKPAFVALPVEQEITEEATTWLPTVEETQ